MIDIIELKTKVYDLLAEVGTTYEKNRVPKDASFPYIAYALENSTEGDTDNTEQVVFALNVVILDHNEDRDTTEVEQLTNLVSTKLHKTHVFGDGYYFLILRVNVQSGLPTPDEYTMRREIDCTVNTYSEEN
jgi:hypothetical protein